MKITIKREQSQVFVGLSSVSNLREVKAIITAFVLLGAGMLMSIVCSGQTTIGFTYDESGNRESRAVISSRSLPETGNYLIIAPESQPVNSQIGTQKVKIRFDVDKKVLQVNFPWLGRQEAIIRIADLHGKQIFQQSSALSRNAINISDYPSGYYRLTVLIGEEEKEWEIVRE